jgi:protein transport protein SEC31
MVRVRHLRQGYHAHTAVLLGLVVVASLATGCKSGSWGAKPSWLGGTPPTAALTSAPSFDKDKDIAKPSEAAKPYPTTSTPEGYALSDATKTEGGQPAVGRTASLVEPTSVTYGATPAPAATPPAAPPAAAVAETAVATQVGPYGSLQPQSAAPPTVGSIDPAGAATAGMAKAPAFGEASPPIAQAPAAQAPAADVPPPQGPATQPPGARYADARAAQGWAASPPPGASPAATGPVAPPQGLDARYGDANGSRFGAPPSAFAAPPAAAAAAPIEPPPAVPAAPPAVVPPATGGDVLPGAIAPPNRRPDPGYRPGGTSSYRPGKTILAGDEPPAEGVVPASFEAAPTGQ